MRILFMGTPDFAAASLDALLKSGREVVGVVTNPDKPKGRGHKMMMCPVKEAALAAGIPVFQPQSLKGGELKEVLDELRPDVICVAAYGKILPEYVLSYPKYGCINVHGSLLPKYRGAAPIQWAVINGDRYTGITTMKMNKGLDTGNIILSEKTEIGEDETSAELFDRLAVMGGELLARTLEKIENNTATETEQDESEATYAPMISKETGRIDWSKPASVICCLVRGMNSWPMAYTYYGDQCVKVISAKAVSDDVGSEPGTILGLCKGEGLKTAAGCGAVIIKEVQFPGGRRMNVEEYMRGHSIQSGEKFI